MSSVGYYIAYGTIIFRTATGALTLGDLTLLSGSFSRSRDLIQRLLLATSDLYEQALHLEDLFAFFDLKPAIRAPDDPVPVPHPVEKGFEFRDVWFRYPPAAGEAPDGSRTVVSEPDWVLRGVSFKIEPGQRWALVGENGAGKTTLIKLLLRLYEPSRGEILLDGAPLSDYDPVEYRRAVSVIFQDFVRYDMMAEDNIAMDRPVSGGENPSPELTHAAERSLAAEVVEKLPQRYGTMLGRRFEGGVDLSGGQWQKIALARAYLRDSEVLILDEPTAALDARAEYEVFQRFSDLTRGKIAILISHRFSTVRMADRILVLENGGVLESGTHEELLERDGRYAELFALQAAGYR